MGDPLDFWILRDAPLTDGELARLLASPPELEPAASSLEGMDRWEAPLGAEDVLGALSNEGIYLAADGEVARKLENTIESAVGGWVHKG